MSAAIKRQRVFIYIVIVLVCSLLLNVVFGIVINKMSISANNSQDILEERIQTIEEDTVSKVEYDTIIEERNNLQSQLKEVQELQAKWRAISSTTRIDEVITTEYNLNRFVNDNGLSEQIDAESFYKLSKRYGIDGGYALVVFVKETGWGIHSPAWLNGNNPAGIKCGMDYCSYNTKEDGIESMFQLLHNYVDGSIPYIGKRTTAIEVRDKWCETKDIDEIIGLWKQINEESKKWIVLRLEIE